MKKFCALLLTAAVMLSSLTGCKSSKSATQVITEGLEARQTEISFRSSNVDETLNEVFQKNPELYYYFSKYGGEHQGKDIVMSVEYVNTDSQVPTVFVVDSYTTLYNVVGLALMETMSEVAMVITDSTLTANDIMEAIEEWQQDNYLVYMGYDGATVDTKSTSVMSWLGCRLNLKYVEDTDEIQEWRQETEEKVVELSQSLFALDMPDYRRELLIHDYLVENTTCEETASSEASYTAYGALVEGKAVCEGYAEAAQLLFQAAELKSYYVEGAAGSGNHAWNCVQVDGEWYWVDVTWDDPVPEEGGTETLSHEYFNLTDTQLNKADHSWQAAKYPSCSSSVWNYDAVQTAMEEEDGTDTTDSDSDEESSESTGKTYSTYSARNVQLLEDEKYQVLTALGFTEESWEKLKNSVLSSDAAQMIAAEDQDSTDQEGSSQDTDSSAQTTDTQTNTSSTQDQSQQTAQKGGGHLARNILITIVAVLAGLVILYIIYRRIMYRRMLRRKRARERARRRAAGQENGQKPSGQNPNGRSRSGTSRGGNGRGGTSRSGSGGRSSSSTRRSTGSRNGTARKSSSSSRSSRPRRENPFK